MAIDHSWRRKSIICFFKKLFLLFFLKESHNNADGGHNFIHNVIILQLYLLSTWHVNIT